MADGQLDLVIVGMVSTDGDCVVLHSSTAAAGYNCLLTGDLWKVDHYRCQRCRFNLLIGYDV